jgi:hypothetical protein
LLGGPTKVCSARPLVRSESRDRSRPYGGDRNQGGYAAVLLRHCGRECRVSSRDAVIFRCPLEDIGYLAEADY